MPHLFSYGTLQDESVQMSTFGRLLGGDADALPGHELASITSGNATYADAKFNGRADSRVPGTVFNVTEAELASADAYDEDAHYVRKVVTLASGKQAWVYVSGR